jgi:hypothetical protein
MRVGRGGELCAKISRQARLDGACWRLRGERRPGEARGNRRGRGGSSEAFLSSFKQASQRERAYLLLWKPLMAGQR